MSKPEAKSSARRNFLKIGAISGAGLMLSSISGCATFDDWLFGDGLNSKYKNIILGAGASGLYASYLLKQKQQDFLLLEGSQRIGGRCYTLNPFIENGQTLELGAEWISSEDKYVLALLKELKISLVEYQMSSKIFGESSSRILACIQANKKLSSRFSREQMLKLPVSELAKVNELKGFNGEMASLLRFSLQTYGTKIDSLSFYHFLQSLNHPLLQKASYKIASGSGYLMQTLFDRISGVVVNQNVRLGYELIGIEKQDEVYNLTFKTSAREKVLKAENVICSLPPAILRKIPGFNEISMSDLTRSYFETFQMANISKGGFLLQDRKTSFISAQNGGLVTAPNPLEGLMFEGSIPPLISMAKSPQVVSYQGNDISFDRLAQKISGVILGHHEQDWSAYPWSRGAWAYSSLDAAEIFRRQSQGWQFVGDYTMGQRPSLESALESIQRLFSMKT